MTLPASRPVITDAELRNDSADLLSLHLKLQQWLQFTYCRDALYVPSWASFPTGGGGTSGTIGGSFVTDTGGGGSCYGVGLSAGSYRVNSGATGDYLELGTFYLPAPLSFARRLEVRAYVHTRDGATNPQMDVDFTPVGGGTPYTFRISKSSTLSGSQRGWISFQVPISGPAWVRVSLRYQSTEDSSIGIGSMSAWWEPLDGVRSDVTIQTGTPLWLSQAFYAAGRADSVYPLKWLAQMAMRYEAHNVRQVLSAHYERTSYGGGYYVVGRYRFRTGEGVTSIEAWSRSANTGYGVNVYLNGSLVASRTISSDVWAYGSTITVSPLTEYELVFTHNLNTSLDCFVRERAPTISLPGSETVPGSFPSLATPASKIAADTYGSARVGRKALVEGMIWIWANRYRHLVNGTYGEQLYGLDTASDWSSRRFAYVSPVGAGTHQANVRLCAGVVRNASLTPDLPRTGYLDVNGSRVSSADWNVQQAILNYLGCSTMGSIECGIGPSGVAITPNATTELRLHSAPWVSGANTYYPVIPMSAAIEHTIAAPP